jgi:hypothetical protein
LKNISGQKNYECSRNLSGQEKQALKSPHSMQISQQQIDPNSLMGLLEQIDQRQEVQMKCRKGSKEYKKLQKELEVLRTKYNETAGQKLFIVHTEL